VPVRLAELMLEAGAPAGILQVVHGDKEMVDAILDHPAISAVSFVGSSDIAHYVYRRGVEAGKRVQAMGGAKNHGIVMPDADLDQVVADLSGAAFGSAGERCMALPVVVPVGDKTADALREKLIPAIEALRVGVSTDNDAHYGPVVNAAHKQRVENWIQTGVDEGAELVVDGRGFQLQGHEQGFFIGPSLFDRVTPDMQAYKEEIFGPVLQIVRAPDFETALKLPLGPPVWQRRRHLHAQRPRRARVRRARQCRDGRHQRADPGARRLSHVRRLEALGVRRHQPARHGRREVLDQGQDDHPALARWRRHR
jgi:malonate-semialdehyde dehydrogenase (acetylating)/methylmalonate-semialdehyde dehydrogenase